MTFSVALFDDYPERDDLLPLVATRPVSNLRVGILTIDQKWKLIFNQEISYFTTSYLEAKYERKIKDNDPVLLIHGALLPNTILVEKIKELRPGQILIDDHGRWLAAKSFDGSSISVDSLMRYDKVFFEGDYFRVSHLEDIFCFNADQISTDLQLLNIHAFDGRSEGHNQLIGSKIFLSSGVDLNGVILDSTKGPIYIGEHAVLEAGVVIHGPAAIGSHCRVKSGTVIYPNVTVGDFSVVGGELNNVVIWGNSAKGHYGYLGCAVIGEGCNLGAGTSNSNLKNDWSTVKLYNYRSDSLRDTGLLKCGVFIGDHAMVAIQSRINTGTVIGVGAQVAMSKFIPKFVPDFSWITDDRQETYVYSKFQEMLQRKAQAKGEELQEDTVQLLKYLYYNKKNIINTK